MKNFFLLITLSLVFILPACEKEADPDDMETECDLGDATYNGVIKEILSGCQGSNCHGAGTDREMTDFTTAKAYASNGRILGALNHSSGFSAMPKNRAKLEQCQIDQVKAWVDGGFPEG